jgi:putative Ca2+/H+ antiporter (TMEM165/GDT1 family)
MSSIPDLLVVAAIIGLIELVDRSNFALLGLASRRGGFATWAGAAAAFLVTSAIAVAIGTVVLAFLGPDRRLVQASGGLLILAYAGYLLLHSEDPAASAGDRSAFLSAFLLILLLELGDTTMILLVLFTGSFGDPVGVFVAGAAALLGVAALACTIGSELGSRVEPKTLDRAVIAILFIVGGATILLALYPALLPSIAG